MADLTRAVSTGLPKFLGLGATTRPTARFTGRTTGTDVIRKNLQSLVGHRTLHFPLERMKYFMRLAIYRYHRSAEGDLGSQLHQGDIILPLSQTLIDSHSVAFDTMSTWTFEMARRGFNFMNQLGAQADDKQRAARKAQAEQELQRIQDPNERSAFQQFIDSLVAQGSDFGRAGLHQLGWAPNQFLTIVLEGPTYKTFELNWSLTASSPAEAEMLRAIIQAIKNAQAPGLSSSGLLFSFPKIWHIGIYPNSSFMFKYKKAVLTDFAANYAPHGYPHFRREDFETRSENGVPLGTPTTIQLSAKFLELEYWLENQHNDRNDPFDVNVPAVSKTPSVGIEF